MWKDGYIEGKGELRRKNEDLKLKANFKENKINGEFIVIIEG